MEEEEEEEICSGHGTAIRKNLLIGDLDLYRAPGSNLDLGPTPATRRVIDDR